ncbi:DsbA family protein [Variovorax sp. J22G21]|uniref:DsbA family protein n=1 Tax=Variovorax fucosicus TaxID=3053517 RepID=UPI002576BF28|nr:MULTISPECIES: DsbA family protein [unclassified Variovorax]MDM0037458.1 DsbA family protein [Variovorax sp. J22R193]MDM0062234.1 DsbA family protein [Variovorax sp. J22G21]
MTKTLHYLFDPLCGWCYGAAPAVSGLSAFPGVRLELLPTGLFSGEGARPMDDAFAAYAWSNDQRIERLTGQRFSEQYRNRVLGDRQRLFDSGPATVALSAVSLTDPGRELEALKAIQHARYVDGNDVTSLAALADLLGALGLEEAAAKVAHPDADLLGANRARTGRAQTLMREFGARGVPTLIAESGAKRWVVDHAAIYSNPQALIRQLEAA